MEKSVNQTQAGMNQPGSEPSAIADRLAAVRERIAVAAKRAGRSAEEVTLIAVSKTKSAQAVCEALAAGQKIFGENRVQEALEKIPGVPPEAEWHLIGHLQSNKARLIPGHFAMMHTLDSEKLARALDRQFAEAGRKLEVLIQLNWCEEPTKSGVRNQAELETLMEAALSSEALVLRGLMTIPDPALDEGQTRTHFAEIRELLEKMKSRFNPGERFSELSMGMSHDFQWAIEEGATMVRVGTAVFGGRQ